MQKPFRSTALALTLLWPVTNLAVAATENTGPSAPSIESHRNDSSGDAWFERTEIEALVEFEAGYYKPESGQSESDMTLATFELGIVSQVNNHLEAGATLLYEEDATPLELDTAYATLGNADVSPFFLTIGQIYVPFGNYETNMISDPLTLEIGETRESALQLGIESGALNAGIYLFNGDIKKGSDNSVNSWGANLGFAMQGDNLSLAVNAAYINNLGDSDSLQAVIAGTSGGNSVAEQTGAYTLNTVLAIGPFNMIAEYLSTADEFAATEVNWNNGGARPSAWNVEMGYTFASSRETTFALGYQASDEALALGLPKTRMITTIATAIDDNTTLAIEWMHDTDYDTSAGSIDADGIAKTGSDEASDTATVQLAITF